ncbi:hypothetical protein [Wolbachia endosymbiont (group A) of Anomoia purmunda]|uniref:hypothetical protein n=1 Tax=Wolbachia endosymbiont (group A) of Anomoia purmunda TaxID=2953978 RepID=UPI00222E1A3D|nr:hypothetical protein [Wolbachia endosymbiont (group A) of Anomoia purmunda]
MSSQCPDYLDPGKRMVSFQCPDYLDPEDLISTKWLHNKGWIPVGFVASHFMRW